MTNFTNDLDFGNEYEKKAINLFEYKSFEIKKGYFKEYDIILNLKNKKEVKIEVKADRKTKYTGNIVIEFDCRGKPSGITTTEADKWVYFVDGTNEVYIIPTKILKRTIEKLNPPKVKGGDDYLSRMYLFNKNVFEKYKTYYNN